MHSKSKKELKFKRTRKPNGAAVTALAYCNGPDVLIAGECYCTTPRCSLLLHIVVVLITATQHRGACYCYATPWCSLLLHNIVIHVMHCAEWDGCR